MLYGGGSLVLLRRCVVDDPCRTRQVLQGARVCLLGCGPAAQVVADPLPDPDGVAAGVGHQELPHAVRHVLQRTDRGSPRDGLRPYAVLSPARNVSWRASTSSVRRQQPEQDSAGSYCFMPKNGQLHGAALDDGAGVGALLQVSRLETQGGVEIDHRLDRPAGQERDGLLGQPGTLVKVE